MPFDGYGDTAKMTTYDDNDYKVHMFEGPVVRSSPCGRMIDRNCPVIKPIYLRQIDSLDAGIRTFVLGAMKTDNTRPIFTLLLLE